MARSRSRKSRTSSRRRSRNNSSRRRSRKSSSRRRSRKSRGGGQRLKSLGTSASKQMGKIKVGLKKKVGMDKVTNCKNLTKKVNSYATIDEYCSKTNAIGDCFNDTASKLESCKTTLAKQQVEDATARVDAKKILNKKDPKLAQVALAAKGTQKAVKAFKTCGECKKFMHAVFQKINPQLENLDAILSRGRCAFSTEDGSRKRIIKIFKGKKCPTKCYRVPCGDMTRKTGTFAKNRAKGAKTAANYVLQEGKEAATMGIWQADHSSTDYSDYDGFIKIKNITDKQINDAISELQNQQSQTQIPTQPPKPPPKNKGGKSRRRSSRKSSKRSSRRRSSRKSSKRSSRRRSRKSRRRSRK